MNEKRRNIDEYFKTDFSLPMITNLLFSFPE